MTDFQPSSKIYIGNAPFDNSYRHTMTFATAQAQYEYFLSACPQVLRESDYTYVRMNHSVKVPFNAELLYTYDYCMYQNSNYGNKWFYAFITAVNYINENATELVLELDVMQTWYFDYTLVQGFVEREHVNDDTKYAHLNPEPQMPFNILAQSKYRCPDFNDCYAIVQTNATPHYAGDVSPSPTVGNADRTTPVSGGLYCDIVNGAAYYAFSIDEIEQMGDDSNFVQFLRDINSGGGAESVTNVFMFPSEFLRGTPYDENYTPSTQSSDSWRNFKVETGHDCMVKPYTFDDPATIDGYTPKNNKCFIYPYNYIVVEDNAGHRIELKYELWNQVQQLPSGDWKYVLQCFVPFDADASAFVVPTQYDGESTNYENALVFPCTPKCSWVYSAFQNWSAQNSLINALTGLTSIAATAVPAVKGISASSKMLGLGVAHAGKNLNALNYAEITLQRGFKTVTDKDLMTGGGGLMGLANLAGTIDRQSKVPDIVKGNAGGNSLYGVKEMTFNVKNMCMQNEFVRILDDFFSMYGYQVDRVKIPNRTGRRSWNYVKMQNSCHRGSVPASDMDKINSIYDAGITFWHTSDVGNYSLLNDIVS